MPNRTAFSILIPFHNSDQTLGETIASIKAQTGVSLDIIIADDHSSPAARAVLDALARKEPRIRIIDTTMRGPSAARNAAAAAATGRILCFLDADDCLRPGALEAYARFFSAAPDAGVAFGRVRITETPSREGGIVTPYCAEPSLAQIIGENRVCTTSNIVVRRNAFADIGGFDETLSHAEDQDWLARAYLHPHWALKGLDQVTLDYRTSRGGLSADLARMETGWVRMIRTVTARARDIPSVQIAEATGLFYRYQARRALRLGASRADGAVFMTRALSAHPAMIFQETRRTWPTLLGAGAVLCFGAAPFRKVFQ